MQTEKNEEIIFKICKTCNESKEINSYRAYHKDCRQCQHKKQAENHLKHSKIFYQKNQEKMKQINLQNYYRRKYNNDNLSIPEINLMRDMCS